MKALFPALAASLALLGCAKMESRLQGWMASSVPAYAVVNGVLLEGQATIFYDRSGGTLRLAASQPSQPSQTCVGDLRYTATAAGNLALHCDGGVHLRMAFTATDALRGFGTGTTQQGPAAFTWGMGPADALAYLPLPAGQRVAEPVAEATPAPAPGSDIPPAPAQAVQ
ncbi:hypothetical protein os1_20810 [Comamonadaceae bacterium OS-1]|nr:hypothetical protein os1_20810 [Comamonadaceae bacterium OS-1]